MTRPAIAAIGMASWDRMLVVDDYPEAGSYAVVRQMLEGPGGTTANTVAALARLGVPVTFAAKVGDDREGAALRDGLAAEGCDVSAVTTRAGEPTDLGIIIISGSGERAERTIYWQQGARLRYGDPLPIAELFAHDLVVVDVDDARLRQLIVDLPIHVAPRTRLLGTLTLLTELPPEQALALAVRHDYLCGNERELRYVTGETNLERALVRLRERMLLDQLRLAFISRGPLGCLVVTEEAAEAVPAFPVAAVDTTGAGDAFAAGVALGLIERRAPGEIGRLANALGALAVRGLGARASLPQRAELDALLGRS
ncbi:MAG TPA: carbohydrate kinase family protein [Thermomicrobiaceae bacterium]|nr:carbohydrate kinase family protein [Thermomicrobiaceae bacterium]